MHIVLIPGDGIGPEVTLSTQKVIAAAGVSIKWINAPAGLDAVASHGDPLPETTLDLIRKYRVALKGPCTTPVGKGFRSINVRLRQGLDLYASVPPGEDVARCKSTVYRCRSHRGARKHGRAVRRVGTRCRARRRRKFAASSLDRRQNGLCATPSSCAQIKAAIASRFAIRPT